MTAVTETVDTPTKLGKSTKAAPAKPKGLVLAGDPTVQLLPPAVRDRAKSRQFRRLMVMLVVLAVVVVAAGVAVGLFRTIAAQNALNDAHAETARILAEQANYRADAAVADLVEATKQAQQLVTSTEVDWNLLYADIKEQLGSKAEISQFSFTTPVPWGPAPVSPGVLRPTPVVTASVTLTSSSVLNVSDVADRFAAIPGFLEAYLDSTAKTGDDGDYITVITVAFDEQRFLERFAATDEATAGDQSESARASDDESTEEGAR